MTDAPPPGGTDGWGQPGPPAYGHTPYTQAPYGQPPYGQAPHGHVSHGAEGQPVAQGWGYGVPRPSNDGLATAALVISLLGIFLAFGCGIGMLLEIAPLPMSIVARHRIRASNGMLTGENQALAALIVSAVMLALAVVLIVVLVIVGVTNPGDRT